MPRFSSFNNISLALVCAGLLLASNSIKAADIRANALFTSASAGKATWTLKGQVDLNNRGKK